MCDCATGFIKIASLSPMPAIMPPHVDEDAPCYAAYANQYYKAMTDFNDSIAAHLDPSCDECVDSSAGTIAYLTLTNAILAAANAYWKCRGLPPE